MSNFAVFDFDALDEEEAEEEREREEERKRRQLEAEEQERIKRLEYEKHEKIRLFREAVLAAELKDERLRAENLGFNGDWAWDPSVLAQAVEKQLEWQRYGIQALRSEAAVLKVSLQNVPLGYPFTHKERSMTLERMWVAFIWQRMPLDLLKFECLRRGIDLFKDDSQKDLIRRLALHVYGPEDGSPQDIRMELHGVPWTGPLANEQGEFNGDQDVEDGVDNGHWRNVSDMHRRDGSVRLGCKVGKSCGPRVRSFLRSFPNFSGEVPGQDAEKWSIFDLRDYFWSNGEQRPASRERNTSAGESTEPADSNIEFDLSKYGPRVQSFLKSYPSFSGEVPGPDAEARWSHFDMRVYFMSHGQTTPPGYQSTGQDNQTEKRRKAEIARARKEAEFRRREAELSEQDRLKREEEQRREAEARSTKEEHHRKSEAKGRMVLALQEHFCTLGLECNATGEEVRKTYRKLALQYHPDKQNSGECDASTFRRVTAAYQAITSYFKDS